MSEELAREGEKTFNGLNYFPLLCRNERSLVSKSIRGNFTLFLCFFLFFLFPILPSRKKSIPFTMKPPSLLPPTQSLPNPSIFPPLRTSTPTQTFSAAQTQLPNTPTTPKPQPITSLAKRAMGSCLHATERGIPSSSESNSPRHLRSCPFFLGMSGS